MSTYFLIAIACKVKIFGMLQLATIQSLEPSKVHSNLVHSFYAAVATYSIGIIDNC